MRRSILAPLASSLAVTVFIAGSVGACNALIATPDIHFDPDGASSGTADGSTTTTADGSTTPGNNGDASPGGGDASPPVCAPGVDLQTDMKNCGVCGHSCLGGPCAAGKCKPIELTTQIPEPWIVAVDSTSVYVSAIGATLGGIYRFPKGADPMAPAGTPITTTPDSLIYDLKVDSSGVYFSWGSGSYNPGAGEVNRCDPDGKNKTTIHYAENNVPRGLSIDGTNAYWVGSSADPEYVQRGAKIGSDAGGVTIAPSETEAEETLVDGQFLYWTQNRYSSGIIRRCTIPACTDAADFIINSAGPSTLAAGGGNLYYASQDMIMRAPTGGATGAPLKVVGNQPQVYSIAVDDKDLYWVNLGTLDVSFNNADVRRCPIVGGAVQCVGDGEVVFTSMGKLPRSIAMDATAVYWTEQQSGKVWRLAR